jgi:hypothetical protein
MSKEIFMGFEEWGAGGHGSEAVAANAMQGGEAARAFWAVVGFRWRVGILAGLIISDHADAGKELA